jgi:hypothetical protein
MYHVAARGESTGAYKIRWVNLKETDHLKDLIGDGRIILRWSCRIKMGAWTGLVCLSKETSAELL